MVYCVACERDHESTRWHCSSGIPMCHASFTTWRRRCLPGDPHPGRMVLHRYRKHLDVTSRRIVSFRYRVDTCAFRDAYVMLCQVPGWRMALRLWVLGIVGQLVWSWPSLSAVTLIGQRPFAQVVCPEFMEYILTTLQGMYGGLKVCDGVLAATKKGRLPFCFRTPPFRRGYRAQSGSGSSCGTAATGIKPAKRWLVSLPHGGLPSLKGMIEGLRSSRMQGYSLQKGVRACPYRSSLYACSGRDVGGLCSGLEGV